jgi:predicted peptidase
MKRISTLASFTWFLAATLVGLSSLVQGCGAAATQTVPDGAGDTLATSIDAGTDGAVKATGFITMTNAGRPAGLYVPPSTGKPLPVVMYLHYCGGDPVTPSLWIIDALNAVEPCAVFAPTAEVLDANCADWGGTYSAKATQNLTDALAGLDKVAAQYGFDVKREYVYGESMGAEAVFKLLLDFPERFAGAVAVGGYTKDVGAASMAKTPLWILHGAEDTINRVDAVRAIRQSILAAGGNNLKYTEYPGLDHVPAINQAHSEPGLMAWLLSQSR